MGVQREKKGAGSASIRRFQAELGHGDALVFFLLSSWWAVFVGPETGRRARVVSSSSELGPLIARRRLAPVDRVWWRSEIGVARSTQADEGASAPECGMNCVQRCANPRGVPGCRRTRGGEITAAVSTLRQSTRRKAKTLVGLWARGTGHAGGSSGHQDVLIRCK